MRLRKENGREGGSKEGRKEEQEITEREQGEGKGGKQRKEGIKVGAHAIAPRVWPRCSSPSLQALTGGKANQENLNNKKKREKWRKIGKRKIKGR